MGAQVVHNAFLNVKLGLWFQFSFHPRSLNKQTQGKKFNKKKKKKILAENSGWALLNSSSLLPQKPMNTNNQPQGKKKK
jgi:hypothetical protein